jgi:hypothetical protein
MLIWMVELGFDVGYKLRKLTVDGDNVRLKLAALVMLATLTVIVPLQTGVALVVVRRKPASTQGVVSVV